MAFEGLNGEGSDTVLRSWKTVRTSLHGHSLHTDSLSARPDQDITMNRITDAVAQCGPLRGYVKNMKQTWPVTLLAPRA